MFNPTHSLIRMPVDSRRVINAKSLSFVFTAEAYSLLVKPFPNVTVSIKSLASSSFNLIISFLCSLGFFTLTPTFLEIFSLL